MDFKKLFDFFRKDTSENAPVHEERHQNMTVQDQTFIKQIALYDYLQGSVEKSGIMTAYKQQLHINDQLANKVYQTEFERLKTVEREGQNRLIILSTKSPGEFYSPHEITYNKPLSEDQVEHFDNDYKGDLEKMYAVFSNVGVQPLEFYGHRPSVGDGFIIMTPEWVSAHFIAPECWRGPNSGRFTQELDRKFIMSKKQWRFAAQGMTVKEEYDLLKNIQNNSLAKENKNLHDLVDREIKGRIDSLQDQFHDFFSLTGVEKMVSDIRSTETKKGLSCYRIMHDPEKSWKPYRSEPMYDDQPELGSHTSTYGISSPKAGDYLVTDRAGISIRATSDRDFDDVRFSAMPPLAELISSGMVVQVPTKQVMEQDLAQQDQLQSLTDHIEALQQHIDDVQDYIVDLGSEVSSDQRSENMRNAFSEIKKTQQQIAEQEGKRLDLEERYQSFCATNFQPIADREQRIDRTPLNVDEKQKRSFNQLKESAQAYAQSHPQPAQPDVMTKSRGKINI